MENLFKKGLLVGLGLATLTKEKADELVQELIKKGEMTQDEGAKFIKEMMDKTDQRTKEMKQWVDTRVNEVMDKMRPKTLDKIDELNAKVDKLQKEIGKLQKEITKLKKSQ